MITTKLDAAIRAVCPIHGISIGRKDDKTTWRIDFTSEATEEQKAAARAVLASFDPNPSRKDEILARLAEIDAEAQAFRWQREMVAVQAYVTDSLIDGGVIVGRKVSDNVGVVRMATYEAEAKALRAELASLP